MRMLVTGMTVATGLAAVVLSAPPAAATSTGCVSLDLRCQGYTCPADSVEVFNNGYNDTGPWVVVCRPKV